MEFIILYEEDLLSSYPGKSTKNNLFLILIFGYAVSAMTPWPIYGSSYCLLIMSILLSFMISILYPFK